MPKKRIPNRIVNVDNNTIGIILEPSQKICFIDKDDYKLVKPYRWTLLKGKYALARIPKSKKSVLMHRLILDLSDQEVTDHANRNGLDNRKCNLRRASLIQNGCNREKFSGKDSIYKGVSRVNNNFIARITVNCQTINLGIFETEEDAAKAYNNAAIKYFKEFACLNEIEDKSEPIRKITRNASGYLGVCRLAENRYQARISLNGKCHSLGVHRTPEEAALVYNKKALEFFKEKAKLNLIK